MKKESSGFFEKMAVGISNWSEKWFPDTYVFALLGVLIVAVAAWSIGAPASSVSAAFGDGFWSLIPFTLQMTMLIISGYVVSVSKPVEKLIIHVAKIPELSFFIITSRCFSIFYVMFFYRFYAV